jgi:hypothetical protein
MPLITIGFQQPINVSVQVGDLAWYVPTNLQGVSGNQYQTNDIDQIVLLGVITAISGNILTIDVPVTVPPIAPPTVQDFIMFSKDSRANISGVIGYYAKVKFINDSKGKIELFAVGSEIFESSK